MEDARKQGASALCAAGPKYRSTRKRPRQADSAQGDNPAVVGRNVRGGTRPRLSCGTLPVVNAQPIVR